MKVVIQTPGFKAQKQLTEFIENHMNKLDAFSDRIQEGQVCLRVDTSDTKENKVCEIKLVIPGNDLFASKQSNSFEGALLETIDAIRSQLERRKGLLHDHSVKV
jgi:putative sigma-54 modulation protein